MGKLDGKIALITGGSTGIGLATAKLFLSEGARVVVTARGADALTKAQKELGPQAWAVQSDVSRLADLDTLIEQIRARYGRIDILFANAGLARFAPVEQADEAGFDMMFDTNVKGLFFTVQKALPLIPEGGSVLLTASVAAAKGFAGTSIYSATKAAVRSFGRTMAAELAPKKIRVNVISPGPVATPIYSKLGMADDATRQFEESMSQLVGLKRFAQPEEIATTALFLASQDGSYMVGAEILVDGGLGAF